VRDRNRITGAGVTAGLDFGLTMVAELRDRTYAECCQLMSEYDPDPPFSAGSMKTAPPGGENSYGRNAYRVREEVRGVGGRKEGLTVT
jgi:hypothetical protein